MISLELLRQPDILTTIKEEYPLLKESRVSIKKRFQSPDGRAYNTYLLESDKEGFERFVAKGAVHKQYSLNNEWYVLNLLQRHNARSPRLLIADHEPEHYMLLGYVEGKTASELVEDENIREHVFTSSGNAAGKMHTIPAHAFGDLRSNNGPNWQTYMDTKLQLRFSEMKPLVTGELFDKTQRLYKSLNNVLVEEAKGSPVLIQRDMYFDNFIINPKSNEATILDYTYAIGGKPFYDLGKLYITEFYKHPEYKDIFLKAYQNFIPLPGNFNERMKLYILKEAVGMVHFFDSIGEYQTKNQAIKVLTELVENKGTIAELLS